MLKGLKVSYLACKCVFHRPEHNAKGDLIEVNFEGLKIQKWNISTNRARRVDAENGVTFLVIMFTPGVMVIEISKNGSFFVFFADDSKELATV